MPRYTRSVFLSSTTRDLSQERQDIARTIGELYGWACDPMEAWSATPHSPVREIQRRIKNSDVFVGILGHRYGSSPYGSPTESFTELEYGFAKEFNKDRLMFITTDDFPYRLLEREDDARFARQTRFRERVSADLLPVYVNTPALLAAKVILSIANWIGGKWEPVFDLPLPADPFYGRTIESEEIVRRLKDEKRLLVYGDPGIGKTELVREVARVIKNDPLCYDGQLLIDHTASASTLQKMEHVIRAFHPLARCQKKTEDRLRKLLKKKNLCIIIENADDADGIAQFLRQLPQAIPVIVVSRSKMKLGNLIPIEVPPLSDEDCKTLLLTLCGSDSLPETLVHEVIQNCAGNPLKISEVAGLVRTQPDKVRDTIRALRDVDERTALRKHLAVMEQRRPDIASHLKVLSVIPKDFNVRTASAVWQVDEDEARHTLDVLTERQWINLDQASERYSFHEIKRSIVNTALSPMERDVAKVRCARYYVNLLDILNKHFVTGDQDIKTPLREMQLEWANIEQSRSELRQCIETDHEQAKIYMNFSLVGTEILSLRQKTQDRREWLNEALSIAGAFKDEAAQSRILDQLGVTYREMGQPEEAKTRHLKAMEAARRVGNRRLEAMALGNLGRASWELGEKDEAEDCYKKALEILDVEDDPIQKAGMLDSLGMIERECRNPKKAEELHRQALTLAKDHRNRRVEARSRDNLGLDFFRQGKIESSLQCFNDAFGLSHEIGDLFEEVSILTHLGAAYREAAEKQDGEDFFSKAEDCLTRARDLSQVIGDRRIEGRIHADFGLLWLRKGELDRALECHKEHLRVAKEMHDPWGENAALYHLGLVHLQGGKIADAKHDLEDARRLATQLGSLLRGPIEDALKSADLKK